MKSKTLPFQVCLLVGLGIGLSGCVDKEKAASALNHRCAMEAALEKAKNATDAEEVAAATKEAEEARELFQAVTTGDDGAKILEAIADQECP